MHYVDVNGLEIDRTATVDASGLAKTADSNNIVKISDWVNNAEDGTRKVAGYIYQKATLGQNGTEITGLKVAETSSNSGAYKLYYTTDSNPTTSSKWTEYTDSVSGNRSNNADIYLYFKSTSQRVNVHYVDEDGNILINPQYKYANQVYTQYSTSGLTLTNTNTTENSWAEQIQGYAFTGRVHMGETGWQGFAFSVVKGIKEGEDNSSTGAHATYRFQYKLKSTDAETAWTDLTATDVYLIYKKTVGTKLITIHYIDRSGAAIKDDAGNDLTKVVDAGDWADDESTWTSLYGLGDSIDGYAKDDVNQYTEGSETKLGADGHGILKASTSAGNLSYTKAYSTDSSITNPSATYTFGDVTGNGFRWIRYKTVNGSRVFQVGDGNKPSDLDVKTVSNVNGNNQNYYANRYWSVTGDFDIYLVYKPATTSKNYTYTVHYVDEDGNEIPNSGTTKTTIAVTGRQESATVNLNNIQKTISGYEAESTGYLGRATAETGGIPFTSITFTRQKDGDNYTGKWTYSVTNGSGGTPSTAKQLNLENLNMYVIYKEVDDEQGVTVHFVDTSGKELTNTWTTRIKLYKTKQDNNNETDFTDWNGFDFVNTKSFGGSSSDITAVTNQGYSFVGEYIGPDFNMDADKLVTKTSPNINGSGKYIQWKYDSGTSKWYVSHGDSATATHQTDGTDKTVFSGYTKDIYWVYSKTKLNIHYVYTGTDNSLTEISQNGLTNPTTVTPSTDKNKPTQLSSGDNVANITGKVHIGTRIGPSWKKGLTAAELGPNVTQVYAENGQLYYSFSNATSGSSGYQLKQQGSNKIWVYAASSGRRFTLTGDDAGNYTIGDSQHGTFTLNMTENNTWTATFHGEAETTEYTVKKTTDNSSGAAVDTYTLTLNDYIPNSLTDVYEMYIDDTSDEAKVWIDDDLMYSGYFTVGRNSWLETRMASGYSGTDKINNYYYTWEKIVTGSEDGTNPTTTTSTVNREQNGLHWNIAYVRSERTWLDVEADNGGLNDTTQQKVSYRVTLHYQQGDSTEWKEVTSEPVAVNYYSQLENGSFEIPSVSGGAQIGQADYLARGGVWKTTGSDQKIEIVSTSEAGTRRSYDWNDDVAFTVPDANVKTNGTNSHQFAELNAEAAGALYQDVVTHPNELLNYWFSHRARGQWPKPASATATSLTDNDKRAIPEYDTMYLVIMPTKLAMTGASGGGELQSQDELKTFIAEHGGYDSNLATSVGQEITYRDDENGILILKVSSNDQFWHNISVPSGYTAKAGLTRFFFVAGPTAWTTGTAQLNNTERVNPTHGNFIDAVGFSQSLPPAKGFNLVVTKTFSGLTNAQILSLVSSDKGEDKFKITINDTAVASDGTANDALNNAVLSFESNPGGTGANQFKLTAKDGSGNDLLTGGNTGNAAINDNGSVTMTWTFLEQTLRSGNDAANDQGFLYEAKETGDGLTDYSVTATTTVSPEGTGENQKGKALVTSGTDARFTFANTYRSSSDSDQPRIIVEKKFFGLTPSAVDQLFGDGYQLTVEKTVTEGTAPSETLNTDKQAMGSNVTLSDPVVDSKTHNTTYRWTIAGENWGAGTYKISEEKYNTSEYTATAVKIGTGKEAAADATKLGSGTSETASKESLVVGTELRAATLTYNSDTSKTKTETESSGSLTGGNLSTDTNLIIAQYQTGTSPNITTSYLVWTKEPVGARVAQAILNKINTATTAKTDAGLGWGTGEGSTSAELSNTSFRSGDPGTISRGDASVTYNKETGALTFTNGSGTSWKKFFSSIVTGLDTADITVENLYNPVIRILKVDSTDSSNVLAGAVFHLYQKVTPEGGTEENHYYTEITTTTSGSETKTYAFEKAGSTASSGKVVDFTTGSNGMVSLPANLAAETYYLEETTTPSGYTKKITNPITFKVKDDGSVTLIGASSGEENSYNGVTLSWDNPYYQITVPNEPVHMQIVKKSSATGNPVLGGAQFKIFRMRDVTSGGNQVKEYFHQAEGGAESWTTTESDGNTFTTADGSGVAALPGLYADTYYLEEVGAPTGFNMLSKPVAFTVTGSGTVEIPAADNEGKVGGVEVANSTTKNGTDNSVAKLESSTDSSNLTTYSIVIKDGPAYVLPSTGGSGTRLFHVLGLTLISLVAAMAVVTLRKA